MKKMLSILLFIFLGIFLLIPGILSLSLHHSNNHGGGKNCIAHCMFEAYIPYQDIAQSSVFGGEIFLIKIIHALFQEVYLSPILLFFVLIFAPPNVWRYIKNYNYALLVGILKLTN